MCLTEHKKVQKFDGRVPGSLSRFPPDGVVCDAPECEPES